MPPWAANFVLILCGVVKYCTNVGLCCPNIFQLQITIQHRAGTMAPSVYTMFSSEEEGSERIWNEIHYEDGDIENLPQDELKLLVDYQQVTVFESGGKIQFGRSLRWSSHSSQLKPFRTQQPPHLWRRWHRESAPRWIEAFGGLSAGDSFWVQRQHPIWKMIVLMVPFQPPPAMQKLDDLAIDAPQAAETSLHAVWLSCLSWNHKIRLTFAAKYKLLVQPVTLVTFLSSEN